MYTRSCVLEARVGLMREVTEKSRTKAPRQIISADKCGTQIPATNRGFCEKTPQNECFFDESTSTRTDALTQTNKFV